MLQENYWTVKEKINEACKKAGRNPEEVTLIAVSKTKQLADIEEVMKTGCVDFGENKVQELCEKEEQVSKPVHWHLIGHLQTNKVKYIVEKAWLIHSVDSVKLAEEISKQAVKAKRIIPVLIEVNIAGEDSKFGIAKDECIDFIQSVNQLPGIAVKGLMTVPPFVENAEDNRQYFKALKQLSVDIMQKNIDNVCMDFLSMGMSGDYTVAIEEGANIIRVGTSIFGERDYFVKA